MKNSMAKKGLDLSSYLKYIEFVIHIVSSSEDSLTIQDIKKRFKEKFNTEQPYLLNQNFAILRLIPMIFIKNDYKSPNNKLEYDIKDKIKIIRDSIAHGDSEIC